MSNHKSAMGKIVDMAALVAKNEKVRAVGNQNVNARGDTIDSHGNIIQSVSDKVSRSYSNTVGSRTAQAVRRTSPTAASAVVADELPVIVQSTPEDETLSAAEMELNSTADDDIEVEKIKAAEIKKGKK